MAALLVPVTDERCLFKMEFKIFIFPGQQCLLAKAFEVNALLGF